MKIYYNLRKGLSNKNEQLTTLQANKTRFFTKIRWIIEDINGTIKQHFRVFDGTIQNSMLIHIMDDWKIACAFINCSDLYLMLKIVRKLLKK